MDLQIAELEDMDNLRELASLFARIWERPDEPPVDASTLRALGHSGNYISGARLDGRLIGGLIGWLGGAPPKHLHLHSHILGVLPDAEARGVGFALKQHQRLWCIERALNVVEWTFDPLVRRNAYFNLTKLGADAVAYLVDLYGSMDDGINAGDESDRLLVRWTVDSPKATAAARGLPIDAERAASAAGILSIGANDEPMTAAGSGPTMVAQVPNDIVVIRRTNPELARRWRGAVRTTIGAALEAGYRITAVTKDGWYILNSGTG